MIMKASPPRVPVARFAHRCRPDNQAQITNVPIPWAVGQRLNGSRITDDLVAAVTGAQAADEKEAAETVSGSPVDSA